MGISGTSRIGEPSTEEPQLTSKLLMTSTEQLEELISSSSGEELDKDELEVSSLSESESGACCALGTSGV